MGERLKLTAYTTVWSTSKVNISTSEVYTVDMKTGLAGTNVEGDLKVEHQNLDLKLGLLNLAGQGLS